MRYHKYSLQGIDITDAIRDQKTVIVMMPDKSEFKPILPLVSGIISGMEESFDKITLFIDKKKNCKVEVV